MAFGRMGSLGRGFGALGSLGSAAYNPVAALGSDLLGYWDANRADLITQSGGSVSSWMDIKFGYDATQATGSAKPVYSATSFNGAPGVTFDGIDDQLTVASHSFPTGATPCEMWALMQNDLAGADVTTRGVFSYGSATGTGGQRSLRRTPVASVNRGAAQFGDGVSSVVATDTVVALSSRHVVRCRITATAAFVSVDGNSEATAAGVPATASGIARLGNLSLTAGTNFHQGKIAAVLITNPLSAAQASALQSYLMNRRML